MERRSLLSKYRRQRPPLLEEAGSTSKSELELEKLRLEIKHLRESTWRKPAIVLPVAIPVFLVAITYFLNKDYVNAQLERRRVEMERANLETVIKHMDLEKRGREIEHSNAKQEEERKNIARSLAHVRDSLNDLSSHLAGKSDSMQLLRNTASSMQAMVSQQKESRIALEVELLSLTEKRDSMEDRSQALTDTLMALATAVERSNEDLVQANTRIQYAGVLDQLNVVDSLIVRVRVLASNEKYSKDNGTLVQYRANVERLKGMVAASPLRENVQFNEHLSAYALNLESFITTEWYMRGKTKNWRKYGDYFYHSVYIHSKAMEGVLEALRKGVAPAISREGP